MASVEFSIPAMGPHHRLVRHPIYSGGIFVAFGWALWVRGWLTLAYALILFVY